MPRETCTKCKGVGIVHVGDDKTTCICTRVERADRYIARHEFLVDIKPSRALVTVKSGRTHLRSGHLVLTADWSAFLSALRGWMATAAIGDWYPRLLVTNEDELRGRYFGRGSDGSSSTLDFVLEYDLIVIRLGRSTNKATIGALIEAVQTAATAPTPVTVWLVIGPGRTIEAHPAFRKDGSEGDALKADVLGLLEEHGFDRVTIEVAS